MPEEQTTHVVYSVLYQKAGDSTWWCFTNTDFRHEANLSGMHNETTDLMEAQAAAEGLVNGTVFIDSRPKYQHKISATQVMMSVWHGGVVATYGNPTEEE